MQDRAVFVPFVSARQDVVIVDVDVCDLTYGPFRKAEPAALTVQKAVWARSRMNLADKVRDTLRLATKWPLLLLRIREQEHTNVLDNGRHKNVIDKKPMTKKERPNPRAPEPLQPAAFANPVLSRMAQTQMRLNGLRVTTRPAR